MRNVEAAKPWELVHQCTLSEWAKHEAVRWGFDPLVNYTSRLDQRYQPWTTRGRFFQATIPCPETQDSDLPADCMYATMSITEKKNNYTVQCISLPKTYFKEKLSFVEVIGFRRDFAIVQVALDYGKTDLYLVDMRQDTAAFLCSEHCADRPYVLECCLAPDLTCMLIKPNDVYSSIFGHLAVNDSIKCIRITKGKGPSSCTVLQGGARDVAFAFDPRFKHSRIAMANMVKNELRVLRLYDLESNSIVREAPLQSDENSQYSRRGLAQSLTFSPDGSYIACLMRPGRLPETYYYQSPSPCFYLHLVNIYHAESLSCIRVINRPNMEIMAVSSLAPATIFPMFSMDGTYLAVAYSTDSYKQDFTGVYDCPPYNKVNSVLLYKVPPTLSLGDICRSKIRKLVKQEHVRFLPLPSALKRFLLFVPQHL